MLTIISSYENLKKSDLEVALDEHMRANQTKLAKDNALQPYYKRVNNPSPVKKEAPVIETKTPRVVRRNTKESVSVIPAGYCSRSKLKEFGLTRLAVRMQSQRPLLSAAPEQVCHLLRAFRSHLHLP
jgi:hypothetical protein